MPLGDIRSVRWKGLMNTLEVVWTSLGDVYKCLSEMWHEHNRDMEDALAPRGVGNVINSGNVKMCKKEDEDAY